MMLNDGIFRPHNVAFYAQKADFVQKIGVFVYEVYD